MKLVCTNFANLYIAPNSTASLRTPVSGVSSVLDYFCCVGNLTNVKPLSKGAFHQLQSVVRINNIGAHWLPKSLNLQKSLNGGSSEKKIFCLKLLGLQKKHSVHGPIQPPGYPSDNF